MNLDELVAIDVHTHAEISVRDPQPPTVFQEAAQKYFKHEHDTQPTIPEIAAYYRERKMACVIFSVDGLRARGIKPVSNEEVAELAAENADVMIPFASIDPASGAARRARGAPADRALRRQGLQVPSAVPGVLPERSRRVSALRGRSRSTSCPRCSTRGTPAWAPGCPAAAVSG